MTSLDSLNEDFRDVLRLFLAGDVEFLVVGAPLSTQGVAAQHFAEPGVVYQIGLPPRRIDVLTEISGLSFDEAWSTHESVAFESRSIPFIGREAFIRNKEAAGRPKDLADASRLKRRQT